MVDALTPAESQFVEAHGLFFERLGFPRIGGRVLALLLVAERPLTLDAIARQLRVSKASVSTNSRNFVRLGVVDEVTFPGDRRTYFAWSPRAWARRTEIALGVADGIRQNARMGLQAISADNVAARERLEQGLVFADLLEQQAVGLAEKWRAIQEERGWTR